MMKWMVCNTNTKKYLIKIHIVGEFEAPLIPNPECESAPGCGEWEAPMINNPEYKGKWKPKMIANPEYKGMV